MSSNITGKTFRYTLWGGALFLTLFTIIKIFIQYNKPLPPDLPEINEELEIARFYSLIANLIVICIPFGCSLYATGKELRFSVLSPKLQKITYFLRPLSQIFILFIVNSRLNLY